MKKIHLVLGINLKDTPSQGSGSYLKRREKFQTGRGGGGVYLFKDLERFSLDF